MYYTAAHLLKMGGVFSLCSHIKVNVLRIFEATDPHDRSSEIRGYCLIKLSSSSNFAIFWNKNISIVLISFSLEFPFPKNTMHFARSFHQT